MNVSEYIFDFFAAKGIDTVFMVTGGQAMWLDDAVGKNKKYQILCTHHEQSAAMSADAYGRIKGKPAIALVTAGPGSVNAMNGVVGGWTDSSPMIVISGQAALSFVQYQEKTGIRQYGIQGINIKPLVESVTKYFVTMDDVTKVKYYLEKAYQSATQGRPGPVWIDVPLDIQGSEIDELRQIEYKEEALPCPKTAIQRAIEYSYALLKEAKRPLLLVGQGVSLAHARNEFRQVLDKMNIPVITARLGIDLVETEHPLYVGRPGNYGERAANFAVQNADVILSIGCRLSSAMVGHNPQEFGKHARIIEVDIDAKELHKPGVRVDYKVQADCRDFLRAFLAAAETNLPDWTAWCKVCAKWKRNYPVLQEAYAKESPVNSYYFMNMLSKLAAESMTILVDTGSCFHVACQTWKIKKGQTFLTTGGLSSMGYWPAGIGACMAKGKAPTIVITGDGSLQMNIQEFAAIHYHKLPIKVFVINNNGYLLIRHTQRNFMDGRLVGEGPASGVWCPDTMKIAATYGIRGIRISCIQELQAKIQEALEYDGPVICEVLTPEWQLLMPRVASEKLPDGRLVSRNYEDMYPFLPQEELQENMIAEHEEQKKI